MLKSEQSFIQIFGGFLRTMRIEEDVTNFIWQENSFLFLRLHQ